MPPSLGAYEGHVELWPFASLYHEMAKVGLGSAQVKPMLLWEAGAVLGAGFPDDDEAAPSRPGVLSPTMRKNVEYHLAKSRGENPDPPIPDPPDRTTTERLMHIVGGVN